MIDYDESSFKHVLREVLAEVGLTKHADTESDEYDPTRARTDTDILTPTYVVGSDPVGVQIVNDTPLITVARGSISFSSYQITVTDTPQLIVGKNKRRRTVIIKNLDSTNSVALADSSVVTYTNSGLLPKGDALTLDTTGEVWAACNNSISVNLSVFALHDEGS